MKNGTYIDEQIILLRAICQNRTRSYDLLTDEIPVHGKKVRFKWFSLFDEKFRILLPENFEQLPEQIAKVRYVSIDRPPVILSGPDYDDNFGFHLLEDEDTDPDSLLRRMQDALLLYVPETVIYEEGTITTAEIEGRWFEYKNFTVNEETYNMQFLIRIDSSLLVGTFNCRMMFYDEWKPLVLQALEQIERVKKEKRTNESRQNSYFLF